MKEIHLNMLLEVVHRTIFAVFFMMLVFSHILSTINEVSLAKCSFEHVGDRWVYRPPQEAALAFDSRLQVDREQWTEHWEKDTKRNAFL